MTRRHPHRPYPSALLLVILLTGISGTGVADLLSAEPVEIRHQVTGLFAPERVADLQEIVGSMTDIRLIRVDFTNAEAVFSYDAAAVFPGAKPEQIVERLNHRLRDASQHTFGIKPLCTVEPERLKTVTIPVAGLDCKACSLAAYEIVAKLKGVETATASFKTGLVTARIHPDQIDQVELETALKERGVTLRQSE